MQTNTPGPPEVLKQPTTWTARVNAGLKQRAEGEKLIADALRERLDKVGEALRLKECEAEGGWFHSAAYRHLNADQMEKARVATQEARANVPTVGTSEARPLEEAENDQAVMDKWSLDFPMGTPKEKRAAKEMVDDAYNYLAGQVDRIVEKDYVVDLTKED